MAHDINARLHQLLLESPYLKKIQILKNNQESRLFRHDVRALTTVEIRQLEDQGNECQDWNQVQVSWKFVPEFIHHTVFSGRCYLGVFNGVPCHIDADAYLPSGVYHSVLCDVEIGDDALVRDVHLLANYVVGSKAILYHVDAITAGKSNHFGNGEQIRVGMEKGGREIVLFAEMDYKTAAIMAMNENLTLQENYRDFIDQYTEQAFCPFGMIECSSRITHAEIIRDSCIGSNVHIQNAGAIDNCSVLADEDHPVYISGHASLRNSCVQWGCSVTDMALMDCALLTEQSHANRHAKITHAVIAPNNTISNGEVTASVVGPFTGFHHQALLISALWPEGKGNIAYGANVGSNHTGRAPDQEILPGEGVFFGLGCNIKFPANYSNSPYSMIDSGLTLPPQKIDFPFSLITTPSQLYPDEAPGVNEIMPAWVLYNNFYFVKYLEHKFKVRNLATRSDIVADILRPDIVDKIILARNTLAQVQSNRSYYTEEQVPEIGANILTEESRQKAVDAYTFYIEYYCLAGLIQLFEKDEKTTASDKLFEKKSSDPVWEHQRLLMQAEGWSGRSLKENLHRLGTILDEVSTSVLKAKQKDDVRGEKIIPDYNSRHTLAEEDEVVVTFQYEVESCKELIEKIKGGL